MTAEERACEAIGERFVGYPSTHNQLLPDIAAAIRAAEAAAREEMRERCAKAIDGDHIIQGSIGPLFSMGWHESSKAHAAVIRALPLEPPQIGERDAI